MQEQVEQLEIRNCRLSFIREQAAASQREMSASATKVIAKTTTSELLLSQQLILISKVDLPPEGRRQRPGFSNQWQ